jgi:hypothetical protein
LRVAIRQSNPIVRRRRRKFPSTFQILLAAIPKLATGTRSWREPLGQHPRLTDRFSLAVDGLSSGHDG